MFVFALIWPWIGIGAAGLLLVLLCTNALRSDRLVTRWADMVWLTWAGTFVYLVHQFEEHGIDAMDNPYAFRGFLCAAVGHADPEACPVPLSFITTVNVAAVWIAGPLSALLAGRWPVVGLSFFAIPAINIFAHAGPAMVSGRYNPGLLSALVLFLPLCLVVFAAAVTRYQLGVRAIFATLVAGVALHIALMTSLMAFIDGRIGLEMLLFLQVINPFCSALIVVALAGRGSGVRRSGL
ncbi:MAG: HXXEE domain-containing protein [Enhydrobacter sp.]|nr:HXXEE domain-containing protein [Enhydrobacter sp.]